MIKKVNKKYILTCISIKKYIHLPVKRNIYIFVATIATDHLSLLPLLLLF